MRGGTMVRRKKLAPDGKPLKGLASLTRRELEVLKLLAVSQPGHVVNDIAGKLHIAPSTADVHKTNMMRKLGLHTTEEVKQFVTENADQLAAHNN